MVRPRRRILVAALACAAFTTLGGCGDDATGPVDLPAPRGTWSLERDFVDTLTVVGLERRFHVHLPSVYDHQTRLPLLLVFHGGGTTFSQMREWTRLDEAADEGGFVAVYPGLRAWDGNDVEFIKKLVARLTEQWAVDPTRVALTGFSSGGFLSHRLACGSELLVTAVATVGATMFRTDREECGPSWPLRTVPASSLIMLGDEDTSVPLEGRDDALSLSETVAMWRSIDDCAPSPSTESWPAGEVLPRLEIESYSPCALDTEVRSVVMVGIGHTWPNRYTNPSAIDATEIVAEFVARYW